MVLALVFLDELLAMAGLGVYGWSTSARWLLVWLLPLLGMLAWFAFASPKARFGSPVVRPLVKVLVFGLASWGLWAAGHHALAVALLVFSVVVNALAQLPSVRALADDGAPSRPG
jgi:O-antigen/teichoic acid export membrane protein